MRGQSRAKMVTTEVFLSLRLWLVQVLLIGRRHETAAARQGECQPEMSRLLALNRRDPSGPSSPSDRSGQVDDDEEEEGGALSLPLAVARSNWAVSDKSK